MSEKNNKRFFENLFKIGTPECGVFSALLALVIAVLFMKVGFWKTILITVLMLLGAFIGGVKDKKQWFSSAANRLFPAPKPYREENDAIVKAVREAIKNQPPQEEPEEQSEE